MEQAKEKFEIIITPKKKFKVPVELDSIKPEKFAGKKIKDIMKLIVFEGNRKKTLGELFSIHGKTSDNPEEIRIIIEESTSKLWRIGEEMQFGEIIVNGDAGHYIGAKMKGGKITVNGNVGSWIGMEMKGGTIEIHGNAGDYVGGRLRGKIPDSGMKGGMIIIHGNCGVEAGRGMRKGTIIIDGDCLEYPGTDMQGGSILIRGNCTGRAGANMIGGKIVICGKIEKILPSFYLEDIVSKVKVKKEKIKEPFYMFIGDYSVSRKANGRLYISKLNNPHLEKLREKLGLGEE